MTVSIVRSKNDGSLSDPSDYTGSGMDDEADDTPGLSSPATPTSTAKPMVGPAQNGTGRRGAPIGGTPASGIILGN